ncbi:MAG: S9 family peptidase [Gammaproteobacteria bacterium]|nr:S9 family peptidase [Gammaproteobacteria bacterium]
MRRDTQPAAPPGANLVVDGVPAVPADVLASLEAYRNARSASLLGWVGDGVLIATRFGNTTQLHRVDTPLGMRRQITFFPEPVAGASVNPDPGRNGFVYLKDTGGSEFYQMFWYDSATAESLLLGDGKSRYMGVSFSPTGQWLGYSTTERNGTDWDLHAQDLRGRHTVLQEGEGVGWTIEDWSADEGKVLVSRYISVNESRVYEIDVATGHRRRLLPDVTAAFGGIRYGPGASAYFTSDMNGEFRRLHRLDLDTGTITVLTQDAHWDVESFALSRDRKRMAYVLNEDGVSRLFATRLPDGGFIALPALPRGIISGLRFHPDSHRLGFTVRDARAPSDAFSVDFRTRQLTRWTRSELGGIEAKRLVEPELIRYPTFDGRSIPAFVYRPRGPGPHPVIVSIHGGPEGQARPSFSANTQYYLHELGSAVIYPNVRGSRGYGKTYLKLDNGRRREDSVRDIGALLDWIAAVPDLDESRVAVTGGSYGGYMVLASVVHYGDRLRAGVERVGISNFVTFLENTQAYRQDLRRVEYGDERDPAMRAFLTSISPLTHVERIKTPLLISQGQNDPRVPASESEQIVSALKEADIPVWYVLAKDEGHGFRKKPNRDYLGAVTAMFLERHLLAEDEPAP